MEQTKIKAGPKDFFLYLLSAGLLYYNAVWFITLLHQYINKVYPGPYAYNGYYENGLTTSMRWAIASLIVAFPAYIIIAHYLNKDTDAHPEKKAMGVRRWLTYFTLFIAGITMLVDVIVLIFNLLEGDFPMSFFLKALSVLLVAALIFGYYYYELRRDAGKPAPQRSLFRWIAIVAVAAGILGAFFIIGSPKTAREKNFDQTRASDLQSIQWQIINYWQSKGQLPTELSSLEDTISGFRVPTDPDKTSDRMYEYEVTGTYSFNLCATFSYASEVSAALDRYTPYGTDEISAWSHGEGRQCFEKIIDPDLYPVRVK